ncbi:MAG TPA: glutaredoxin family protein [Smithella sp.]|nr:glutaredoxin family protein [Smithella sp.]
MKKFLFFFALLIFLSSTAQADFYKWVDENGQTQITDYPPPADRTAKDIEIHPSGRSDAQTQEVNEENDSANVSVFIYTKDDCSDCDRAREFLNSKKVPFTEYNMDKDPNAVIRRKAVDDSEDVPFAIINRNHVYGFSESVYERALKIKP